MNSNRFFRISSQGLSDHEQGLLQQQLKMLKGRTRSNWNYVEEGQTAEVVIIRDAANQPDFALGAFNEELIRAEPARIEWPLRLFGLMSLLEDCEHRLPASAATPSAASLGALLAGLKAPALLQHPDYVIAVIPELDQVRVKQHDFATLSHTLGAAVALPEVRSEQTPPGELAEIHSLKRLLWAISLTEESAENTAWAQPTQEFRIGKWPLFNEWVSSPKLMRLAALYTRQHASINQGVEFSQASAADIEAFLRACERCGLGLDIRTAPAAAQLQRQNNDSQNLFQRLRNRLGLGINKA